MSYPNQNNPYGPPQGQPQPGYGYPQQPQPYAAYPSGPAGMSGMPGMPVPNVMPGNVKAGRVLLFVMAAHGIIGIIMSVIQMNRLNDVASTYGSSSDQGLLNLGKGALIFSVILMAIYAAVGTVLAVQYSKGGNGIRIGSIVFGSVSIALSIPYAIGIIGIPNFVISILVVVFAAKADGKAWFTRPRY